MGPIDGWRLGYTAQTMKIWEFDGCESSVMGCRWGTSGLFHYINRHRIQTLTNHVESRRYLVYRCYCRWCYSCCHGRGSTMSLQVLTELGSKVLQKGRVQHLLQLRHLISRLRKCEKGRVLHLPWPPRKTPLGRGVHCCHVLFGIMYDVVNCELMMGQTQSAGDRFS